MVEKRGQGAEFSASAELEAVLPLEDEALLKAAKPVVDGKIRADSVKIEQRREAMVKAVMERGTCGVVVLGGSHDLTQIVRMYGGEYVRVWVRSYPR